MEELVSHCITITHHVYKNKTLLPVTTLDPNTSVSSKMIIHKTNKRITVSFRGILPCISHLCTFLNFTTVPLYEGRVYDPFVQRWNELKEEAIRYITLATQEYPCAELIITGHSQGGAIALLCGLHLIKHTSLIPTYIVTIGCPRIGTIAFANMYESLLGHKVVRVWNEYDVVTDILPVWIGFRHIGQSIQLKGDVMCKSTKEDSNLLKKLIYCLINMEPHIVYEGKIMAEQNVFIMFTTIQLILVCIMCILVFALIKSKLFQ
jgi:Lipase (class 3)